MKQALLKLAIMAIAASPVWGEDLKLPFNFDKLAERASESVDVTLDQSTLRLASGFLSKSDPDEAQVKNLIARLRGIYVRSFEFDKEGQYSLSDVQALRAQLKAPNWSRIVGVKSIKGENTEVYLLKEGDQIGGIVVLSVEPKELTVVHVDGSISPEELSKLGGHMGIPELGKSGKRNKRDGSHDAKPDELDDERTER